MLHDESWSAIVLAAGLGERMGGVAKPLIQLHDDTLLVRCMRELRAAGTSALVCVTSSTYAQAMQSCVASAWPHDDAAVHWVTIDAGLPPAHSLRQGLHAMKPHNGPTLVCLADQPLIEAADLRALLQAYVHRPANTDMVVPWVDNQPGNPVCLSPTLVTQWLAHPDEPVGQAWRDQHPTRVHRWVSANPHYRVDLDTLEDVASLRAKGFRVALPPTPSA